MGRVKRTVVPTLASPPPPLKIPRGGGSGKSKGKGGGKGTAKDKGSEGGANGAVVVPGSDVSKGSDVSSVAAKKNSAPAVTAAAITDDDHHNASGSSGIDGDGDVQMDLVTPDAGTDTSPVPTGADVAAGQGLGDEGQDLDPADSTITATATVTTGILKRASIGGLGPGLEVGSSPSGAGAGNGGVRFAVEERQELGQSQDDNENDEDDIDDIEEGEEGEEEEGGEGEEDDEEESESESDDDNDSLRLQKPLSRKKAAQYLNNKNTRQVTALVIRVAEDLALTHNAAAEVNMICSINISCEHA